VAVGGRPPLAEHQRTGIAWIGQEGRGVLGDEPGLGKSRVAIEAFDGGRVLVVAPSMVIAGGTWTEELEKWSDHPENFTVAPYSMLNARNGATTNFGSKKYPKYKLRDDVMGNWDAVIVDEAHYTKGRSTSWTWAVEEISKRAGGVLEMTGTPMPNWAHELYTMLRVIWPEEAKRGTGEFGGYNRWVDKWFIRVPNKFNPRAMDIGGLKACGYDRTCVDRPANDPCVHFHEFAQANLGPRFLRRLRDDVLDLPKLTETDISTPMDTTQARMYRELKKEYVTLSENSEEIVAWTPGSRNVMLDRITTSSWFLDMEGEPRGGKLERLRFDLENRSRPTLVLAHYRDTVDACVRVAESTGARAAAVHGGVSLKDKSRIVADFKSGRLDVLVGSLETLAEGLTLTVADMVIFVEKSYKPSRNEQALRRVHRMGVERPVTALDYITPNSVDANKRSLLASKTDQQMRVLTAAMFRQLL
jgi:SNF2 family DNA or RNA helicase